MAYGIMRCEKRKMQAAGGIQAENNRKADKHREFDASDIDWNKTNENVFLIQSNNIKADVEKELHAYGIDKWRKDAVTFIDGFYGASPEFFEGKTKEEAMEYFGKCLNFHKDTYGDHVINAVVHFDEATPHMHVISVPIVEENALNADLGVPEPTRYKLSAKELMGNVKAYHERQNGFYEQVSKQYGLERGQIKDRAEGREHLSVLKYKQQEVAKAIEATKEELEVENDQLDQVLTLKAKAAEVKKPFRFGKRETVEYDKNMVERIQEIGHEARKKLEAAQYKEWATNTREKELNAREAEIKPLHEKAEVLKDEAQKWHDDLEGYIMGTAENIANQKFEQFIDDNFHSKDARTKRLEELCDNVKLPDGRTVLQTFEDEERELENHIRDSWNLSL